MLWRVLASMALLGCSLQVDKSKTPDQPIAATAEDGSQYVRVDGGLVSSRDGLARQWKGAAKKACDGDFMVLSDAQFERRKAGIVVSRSHEGYVRCVVGDPDRDLIPTPDPPPKRGGPASAGRATPGRTGFLRR